MNLKEIMLANGIDNAVIEKIAQEMKANKIYTASEENLDIRYGKLKKPLNTVFQEICRHEMLGDFSADKYLNLENLQKSS